MSKDNKTDKYYFPYCQICGGVLKITINDNYSINYECSKNENHSGENIYFKTFERFYLKEKEMTDKCCLCNKSFETIIKYICKVCKKAYCCPCYYKDIHISEDIYNLDFVYQCCKIHNQKLIHYCIQCKKNFCKDCLLEKNNNHSNYHEIKNLFNFTPSKNKIASLLDKLNTYDELIKSINSLVKTFIEKIEHLKENILNEKELLNKMVSNFNISLLDYTYYSNFNYLYGYTNKLYNNLCKKWFTFENKLKYLISYMNLDKEKTKTEKIENHIIFMKECDDLEGNIIVKINDNYYFNCSSGHDKVSLITYDNDKKTLIEVENSITRFKEEINSVSISHVKDDIYNVYICLKNKKEVNIFSVYLNSGKIKKIKDEIKEGMPKGFNYCIDIGNNNLATVYNENIINIYKKEIGNRYSKKKEIILSSKIKSLIFVKNKYMVSLIEGETIFFNNKDFKIEKEIIQNFLNSKSLTLYKDYIIVNYYEGLDIISIETIEIIRSIEINNIETCFCYGEIIYFSYKELSNRNCDYCSSGNQFNMIKLLGYKLIEGEFKQISEYTINDVNKKDFDIQKIKNHILLKGFKVYISINDS